LSLRGDPDMSKDRIPKDLSSLDDILKIGDPMRHNRLIDMSFREVVIEGYDRNIETIKATVMLPVWLRREIAILSIDEDKTQGKMFTMMVHQGTALLQEISNPYVTELRTPIRTLTSSDNPFIVDIMQNFSLSVNGLHGGQRRTLLVPKWCKNKLAQIGGYFRIDFSSLTRLSMYLSIQRFDGILANDKKICDQEIETFKNNIRYYSELCDALLTTTKR